MPNEELLGRLWGLINEALVASDQEPVNDGFDPSLFLPDFMDSIAIAILVGLVEEEWDIEIVDDEIAVATFEDLHSLARFVERKITQKGAG